MIQSLIDFPSHCNLKTCSLLFAFASLSLRDEKFVSLWHGSSIFIPCVTQWRVFDNFLRISRDKNKDFTFKLLFDCWLLLFYCADFVRMTAV